jgi:hypothetical protein
MNASARFVGCGFAMVTNALTRTRNLDGIPFSSSFNFDLELIS